MTIVSTVVTGRLGEDAAVGYLRDLGWRILDRNWRCAAGELDIIAVEPVTGGDDVVVFVEVKLRRGVGYGDPLEAITAAKLTHLRRCAAAWLSANGPAGKVRIDAIGITKLPGEAPVMRHLRDLS